MVPFRDWFLRLFGHVLLDFFRAFRQVSRRPSAAKWCAPRLQPCFRLERWLLFQQYPLAIRYQSLTIAERPARGDSPRLVTTQIVTCAHYSSYLARTK